MADGAATNGVAEEVLRRATRPHTGPIADRSPHLKRLVTPYPLPLNPSQPRPASRSAPVMSSNQRRPPRSSGRGGTQENGEELELWKGCLADIQALQQNENEAMEVKEKIFAEEVRLKEIRRKGKEPSPEELQTLENLYRQEVRIAEDEKSIIGNMESGAGLMQQIDILIAMKKASEEKAELPPRGSASRDSRDSVSRSGMDLDGHSDSPGPPSAAERQARKIGAGRPSSQPPRNLDVIIRTDGVPEANERNSTKPKIVYAVNDEVAFKRKSGEDLDWIQGIVTRVIGEGKSRRYEVKDPYPDPGVAEANPRDTVYKSSASQMVPIPPQDAKFEEYEVGKRVLALYPSTSTFYRAEVKRMLEGGTKVEVLFEEETEGREVPRRMVLNHSGQ